MENLVDNHTIGVLVEVASELESAQEKHDPIASRHEGYAVILEELDEFWDEAKRRHPDWDAMRYELIQIAAMAVRTILDCWEDA